jgi:hypothetical protein
VLAASLSAACQPPEIDREPECRQDFADFWREALIYLKPIVVVARHSAWPTLFVHRGCCAERDVGRGPFGIRTIVAATNLICASSPARVSALPFIMAP